MVVDFAEHEQNLISQKCCNRQQRATPNLLIFLPPPGAALGGKLAVASGLDAVSNVCWLVWCALFDHDALDGQQARLLREGLRPSPSTLLRGPATLQETQRTSR